MASGIKAKNKNSSVYLLPIALFQAEAADEARSANAKFLTNTPSPVLPVVDPALGVATNQADFADTTQHLIQKAMIERTKEVARILSQKEQ